MLWQASTPVPGQKRVRAKKAPPGTPTSSVNSAPPQQKTPSKTPDPKRAKPEEDAKKTLEYEDASTSSMSGSVTPGLMRKPHRADSVDTLILGGRLTINNIYIYIFIYLFIYVYNYI